MAAKQVFEPHEIPKFQRTVHQSYSVSGQSQVEDTYLIEEFTAHLLDDSGLTLDGFDLKQMFEDYRPDQLLQVIGKHGVMWLGEMKIDRFLLNREFKGRTTLTIGKEEMHTLDWKAEWMNDLMKGKKYDPSGMDEDLVDVEAFVVTIRNAAGVRQNGLLHPLIKRWEANDCPIEVWGLATVRALVSYKWNHWARHYVAIQFGIYCCWVVSFITLACTYKLKESTLSSSSAGSNAKGDNLWDGDGRDAWTIFHVLLTQLLMIPFTYLFLSRIFSKAWHWFNFWDVVDILTQGLQVICTILFLSNSTFDGFDIILASQTVLLVTKIQFYARAFVAVDSSLLDTLKAVVGSIRLYLLRLVLIICSFACALFILYRKNYRDCIDFSSFGRSVLMMCSIMLGEWEMDKYLGVSDPFDKEAFDATYTNLYPNESINSEHYNQTLSQSQAYTANSASCYWNETRTHRPRKANDEEYESEEFASYIPNLEVLAIITFLCIYMVLMSVLFYHLLIAMVIDAHSRQMEVRKLWVHLSRAEIINILENAMPKSMTEKYVYPYIHVLRVIPRRSPHLDRIWRHVDATETSLQRSIDELESRLNMIELDIFSRIEGISDRIRQTLGIPEDEYRRIVYRKIGIAQMRTMSRRHTFRLSAKSSKKLLTGFDT